MRARLLQLVLQLVLHLVLQLVLHRHSSNHLQTGVSVLHLALHLV